ncbi:YcaO-like family protein [Streptomyces sp. NPDC096310]|uniref:YcaO-like family protein n=1 Tax=Streptomyces sp. NPDC096310 TaxID=3366082 RepID=UPI0037F60AC9
MTAGTSSDSGIGSWVEREIGLTEAGHRAHAALGRLGLRAILTEAPVGEPLSMWTCKLRTDADEAVPYGSGSGKGSGEEAKVGALFEALEHHLTGPAAFEPQQVQWCSGGELLDGPLEGDACAPLLRHAERLACQQYTPLNGPARSPLPVPLIMSTSWYYDHPEVRQAVGDHTDYRQLARYGSNNGSAIGSSLAEALVHALNECVERDALSLLLARAWPGAGTYRPRLIDTAALPPAFAAAHRQAEQLRGSAVHLIEITTDLGVPTYVACAEGTGSFEGRFGCGTSLSPRYAAWRALGEFVQCSSSPSKPFPEYLLDGLDRYPALRACATLNPASHLEQARPVGLPAEAVPLPSPQEQLGQLTARLSARGYQAYYRVTATAPEGITAVHVVVPALERFMVVTSGMVVIPGPRARAQITEAA